MMEVPQLHGFGPAANRLLEAYKMLWKVLHMKYMFVQYMDLLVFYGQKACIIKF